MKKGLLLLSSLVLPALAFASGGFTWISTLIHHFHLPIAEHVLTFILVAVMIIVGGLIYRSKLAKVPNPIIPDKGFSYRNLVEAYGRFIYTQCRMVLGEHYAPKYFPFIATVFLVILLMNLIGLVPGVLPPTEHLSTTFALGCFSFIFYNIKGCKENGVINYFKHFAGPLWYMAILIFPIEIISNFIRPMSLALRLRGNMMGDHLVLSTFTGLAPFLVPIPFYLLGLLVCFIQAYVFTMLTMVYISLAMPHHDHGEHSHGH